MIDRPTDHTLGSCRISQPRLVGLADHQEMLMKRRQGEVQLLGTSSDSVLVAERANERE